MGNNATNHLEEGLERYLRGCDAPSTRRAYERELRRLIAWLPAEPGGEVLYDYRDHLRERGLSPTTVRWRMTVARAYLAHLGELGQAPRELAAGVRLPKGTSGFAPRVLSARELRRLLEAPDRRSRRGRRDAAVLTCLGLGGLRAGEVCRLNFEDLSLRPEGIQLRVNGKGRKRRLVAIPDGRVTKLLRAYLSSWPEARQSGMPLFWCGQPGHETKRLTVPAIDYLVRKHSSTAGLERVSAHALRHTAASLAIEAGEPLHRLRDRLGHSSVLVTSRYLHIGHT